MMAALELAEDMWRAAEVLAALDAFATRAGRRTRPARSHP
jgi:hypothetical protein